MNKILYGLIAVLGVAAGFGISHYLIDSRSTGEPEQSAIAPDPASMAQSAGAKPEDHARTHLPDFVLTDREGTPRSIRSWPGKSLIVNFWATWCAPCRREIPLLKEIQEQRGAEGFQVVGIAVDFREDVLEYADEMAINYPLLIGEQDGMDAIAAFGITAAGFPFTVFTDAQSRIVMTHVGELHSDEARILLDIVARVNGGELTPDAARVVAAKQLAALNENTPQA